MTAKVENNKAEATDTWQAVGNGLVHVAHSSFQNKILFLSVE